MIKKLAGVFLVCILLTGCTTQKEKMNYTEEELPYGATMRTDKKSFAVPMTWDRRFLNEEQLTVVANYLAGIQNQDTALYESASLPLYTQYQVSEVYDYKNTEELVTALHKGISGQLTNDFEFEMVNVDELSDDRDKGGMKAILKVLDGISEKEKPFSATLQNAWTLTVDWQFTYQNGEKTGMTDEQYIYLFQTDGKYYCCM